MAAHNKMEIIAIIPARGGSKGIPDKNIYPLNGKPLIAHTIEAAKHSRYIKRILLSTDSEIIRETARPYHIDIPFMRPRTLATDDTPTLPVIQHAVRWLEVNELYRPDYIILLQPTSPLRTHHHIDEALEKLTASDADSIVSVVEVPHQYNPYSLMEIKDEYLKPYLHYDERENLRQKKPVFYARNGAAIYAFTYDCLMNKNSLYGEKILPYHMCREDSIDIDDLFDVSVCEMIMKQNYRHKQI